MGGVIEAEIALKKKPSISIITATLNCAHILPQLVLSLLAQDDQDFDWIVVDGGSVDATELVARKFPATRLTYLSGRDFGIYDAINKGVAATSAEYYLVLGADDQLKRDAICKFRAAAAGHDFDLIAASVETLAGVLRPMRGWQWLRGGNAFVASHAVGTLIRRSLHENLGYYSNRYVNAADMNFVLTAIAKGRAKIGRADFVAGLFSVKGVSSMDAVCSLSDAFRIQLAFGENKYVQLFLYLLRLMRTLAFRRTGVK